MGLFGPSKEEQTNMANYIKDIKNAKTIEKLEEIVGNATKYGTKIKLSGKWLEAYTSQIAEAKEEAKKAIEKAKATAAAAAEKKARTVTYNGVSYVFDKPEMASQFNELFQSTSIGTQKVEDLEMMDMDKVNDLFKHYLTDEAFRKVFREALKTKVTPYARQFITRDNITSPAIAADVTMKLSGKVDALGTKLEELASAEAIVEANREKDERLKATLNDIRGYYDGELESIKGIVKDGGAFEEAKARLAGLKEKLEEDFKELTDAVSTGVKTDIAKNINAVGLLNVYGKYLGAVNGLKEDIENEKFETVNAAIAELKGSVEEDLKDLVDSATTKADIEKLIEGAETALAEKKEAISNENKRKSAEELNASIKKGFGTLPSKLEGTNALIDGVTAETSEADQEVILNTVHQLENEIKDLKAQLFDGETPKEGLNDESKGTWNLVVKYYNKLSVGVQAMTIPHELAAELKDLKEIELNPPEMGS